MIFFFLAWVFCLAAARFYSLILVSFSMIRGLVLARLVFFCTDRKNTENNHLREITAKNAVKILPKNTKKL